MTPKKQMHKNDAATIKQRSNKRVGKNQDKAAVRPQTQPAALIQKAWFNPNSLTASDGQKLQRTIGNQAVRQLMTQTLRNQSVQRADSVPLIQAKLTVGTPNDHYEQEADRVAAQVVKQMSGSVLPQSMQKPSRQRQEQSDEELQTKRDTFSLQRQAIDGGEASSELDAAVNSARGDGRPLSVGLQRAMGQAMGTNFSGVRVHTDARSDQLNRSIQARAFTTGQDVFFRQGAYQPDSADGQELIAHELTHVVQQGGGNKKILQPKSYFKTDKTKNRQGLAGTVEVETTDISIDLKGKLVGAEGEGINAKGTVYMPEYKVADDRNNAPARIREQAGSGWDNYWTPSDALRVQNLSAEPRGVKLGQLLTYYHGLEARKRKKAYVIAMKVSNARGPFYAPLGFKDYNGSKPWLFLQQQHVELETNLRRDADNMTGEEILAVQKKMAALKDEMEDSSMIISTEELIVNSRQQFGAIWQDD